MSIESIRSIRFSIKEVEESLSTIDNLLDDHDEYTQDPLVGIQHAILGHVWLILNEQQNTIEELYKRVYKIPNSNAGAMVRNMRDELGLSQSGLAKELGVSRVTINRWENGHFEINGKNRSKMRDYIKQQNKKEQKNESI